MWSGQILSMLGTRISSIVVPLVVLDLTHSASKAGLAGFFSTLPYLLFYLVAGPVLDRYNRKRVMLVCEAIRIVAVGSIPVALWVGRLTFAQVVVRFSQCFATWHQAAPELTILSRWPIALRDVRRPRGRLRSGGGHRATTTYPGG